MSHQRSRQLGRSPWRQVWLACCGGSKLQNAVHASIWVKEKINIYYTIVSLWKHRVTMCYIGSHSDLQLTHDSTIKKLCSCPAYSDMSLLHRIINETVERQSYAFMESHWNHIIATMLCYVAEVWVVWDALRLAARFLVFSFNPMTPVNTGACSWARMGMPDSTSAFALWMGVWSCTRYQWLSEQFHIA